MYQSIPLVGLDKRFFRNLAHCQFIFIALRVQAIGIS